ncbi:glycosyltransferase [Alphaproteobacteria bacterium]|nr:glycosyltransferase [Alphaproteobacteria bacterium]
MNSPKISIITAVYNGEQFLEDTIKSIICQDYKNFEYIIIDGGSTDKTIEIIQKYEEYITHWITESDEGISDAFNKGLTLASGEYINFQGDGDRLQNPQILTEIFQHVNEQEDDMVSCLIERVDYSGKHRFYSKHNAPIKREQLLFRLTVPHQGLFTHRRFFNKFGFFDIKNVYCMDYEILLRAYHQFPKINSIPIVASKWRDDGVGNGREIEVLREYHHIKIKNRIAPKIILICVNAWILTKYYLKNLLGMHEKY